MWWLLLRLWEGRTFVVRGWWRVCFSDVVRFVLCFACFVIALGLSAFLVSVLSTCLLVCLSLYFFSLVSFLSIFQSTCSKAWIGCLLQYNYNRADSLYCVCEME